MGEIILFRPREGQAREVRNLNAEPGAQIMFFTGVRYERQSEPAPVSGDGDSGAPRAGGRGGRRRRRG